jgi:hypothetical protein
MELSITSQHVNKCAVKLSEKVAARALIVAEYYYRNRAAVTIMSQV